MRKAYLLKIPAGLILFLASVAWSVPGDINDDGKVDLADFFLLADNFGREGPPEPCASDTVFVTQVDTVFQSTTDTVLVTQVDTVFRVTTDTVLITRVDTVFHSSNISGPVIEFTSEDLGPGEQISPIFSLEEELYAVTVTYSAGADFAIGATTITGTGLNFFLLDDEQTQSQTVTSRVFETGTFLLETDSREGSWSLTISLIQ